MISDNRQYIAINAWAVLAPAAMIALLTIGINLTGDAIARSLGRSYVPKTARSCRRMSDAPAPVVEVEGLSLGLTHAAIRWSRTSASASAAGQILGLVGESGSGKTTTALALLGYTRRGVELRGGSVAVSGQPILGRDIGKLRNLRGKVVSYVPQDPGGALNPSLRVGDAVDGRAARAPRRRRAARLGPGRAGTGRAGRRPAASAAATPTSCPAASSSGSRSPWPASASRRWRCWTSPPPVST